jgi:hypothetical protein
MRKANVKSIVRKVRCTIEHHPILILVLFILILHLFSHHDLANADEEYIQSLTPNGQAIERNDEKYHMPFAGEPLHFEFMGRSIDVAARDRGNKTFLDLCRNIYVPNFADKTATLWGDLYIKRTWKKTRLLVIASVLENEAEGVWSLGNFEVIGRFENYIDPFGETGFLHNQDVDQSTVRWGTLSGFIGAGLRLPRLSLPG